MKKLFSFFSQKRFSGERKNVIRDINNHLQLVADNDVVARFINRPVALTLIILLSLIAISAMYANIACLLLGFIIPAFSHLWVHLALVIVFAPGAWLGTHCQEAAAWQLGGMISDVLDPYID